MCKEKSPGELLAEELFYRTKDAGEELESAELARADAFCEEYKTFLNHAKIEREAVRTTVEMLEKAVAISPASGSTAMCAARH